MTLHEPATFATDLLLAGLGAFFAVRLKGVGESSDARAWWIRAMMLMAISAFTGGCYHGFAPEVPVQVEAWWRRCVLWIICGLGFAMGMSLLCELRAPESRRGWRVFLQVKFAAACTLVLFKPEFIVAIADYGTAMLAWLVAAVLLRRGWSMAMAGGVVLSIVAGVVQQARGLAVPPLNHNDLFHLIQALALIAFYRAGGRLGKAAVPGPLAVRTARPFSESAVAGEGVPRAC